MTRKDQILRMAELGVTPSFFAAHTFFWGIGMRASSWGLSVLPI